MIILSNMGNIHHLLPINSDKSIIYNAITTQDKIANWWTRDCIVKGAPFDPENNKVVLWEPVDPVFTKLYKGKTNK